MIMNMKVNMNMTYESIMIHL